MNIEVKGTLRALLPVTERTNFKSRKAWIDIEPGQYPQVFEVELQQAKVGMLDNIPIGTEVTLHLNIRGKVTNWQGTDKCFWSLVVWKVEVGAKSAVQATGYTGNNYPGNVPTTYGKQGNDNDVPDDLPFNRPRTKPSLP